MGRALQPSAALIMHRATSGWRLVPCIDWGRPAVCEGGGMAGSSELVVAPIPADGCVVIEVAGNGPGIMCCRIIQLCTCCWLCGCALGR
jgi:hypothetical protein